jgi:hypothetical protein
MAGPHIVVEGLRELQAGIKKAEGKLPKSLGEAHKEVGRFIIGKLPAGDPHAVGAGSGASIRPSATKREVILRVGHGGRTAHKNQWGKREVQPFAAGRPYIVGTIEENQEAIEEKFLDETMKVLDDVFVGLSKS